MKLTIEPSRREFEEFLELQLSLVGLRLKDLSQELQAAYLLVERQFSRIRNKYFNGSSGPILKLAHNAQYTIILYHLARSASENGRKLVADRVYALLRMVSSADLYYEVKLPKLWSCDHPLGAVIGRGKFSDDATLFFAQNCNIGNNAGIYPTVLGNLHMYANSSLIGNTHVTGNVVLANGTCIIDAGELSDCIVFGRSPQLTFKPITSVEFRKHSLFLFDD